MVSDGQDLNQAIHFAVNQVKVKHFEHSAANVRRRNYAEAIRCSTNHKQNTLKFDVVSPA